MISNPVFLLLASSLPGHAPAHAQITGKRRENLEPGGCNTPPPFFQPSGSAAAGICKMMAEYAMNQSKDADANVTETI
jgi:hypothetical protein